MSEKQAEKIVDRFKEERCRFEQKTAEMQIMVRSLSSMGDMPKGSLIKSEKIRLGNSFNIKTVGFFPSEQ